MAPLLFAKDLEVAREGRRVVFAENLSLKPGESLWLSAPSGMGKSTLLLALARLLPFTGTLELEGRPAASIRPHLWRGAVSLLAHPPVNLGADIASDLRSPFSLSVRSSMESPGEGEMKRELAALGMGEFSTDHPMERLSRGELARVALARTLLARPKVLLLDEPGANLDEQSRALVADRVEVFTRAGGVAVVASHEVPWEFVAQRMSIRDSLLVEDR